MQSNNPKKRLKFKISRPHKLANFRSIFQTFPFSRLMADHFCLLLNLYPNVESQMEEALSLQYSSIINIIQTSDIYNRFYSSFQTIKKAMKANKRFFSLTNFYSVISFAKILMLDQAYLLRFGLQRPQAIKTYNWNQNSRFLKGIFFQASKIARNIEQLTLFQSQFSKRKFQDLKTDFQRSQKKIALKFHLLPTLTLIKSAFYLIKQQIIVSIKFLHGFGSIKSQYNFQARFSGNHFLQRINPKNESMTHVYHQYGNQKNQFRNKTQQTNQAIDQVILKLRKDKLLDTAEMNGWNKKQKQKKYGRIDKKDVKQVHKVRAKNVVGINNRVKTKVENPDSIFVQLKSQQKSESQRKLYIGQIGRRYLLEDHKIKSQNKLHQYQSLNPSVNVYKKASRVQSIQDSLE